MGEDHRRGANAGTQVKCTRRPRDELYRHRPPAGKGPTENPLE